jgi:hypothetical protein
LAGERGYYRGAGDRFEEFTTIHYIQQVAQAARSRTRFCLH